MLREDPGVRDAVVVGRPDPVLGEVPVAYVVGARMDAGTDPGLAERLAQRLAQRSRQALPHDRQPAELTVVEQLPTSGTGKVLRAEVADMARADSADPAATRPAGAGTQGPSGAGTQPPRAGTRPAGAGTQAGPASGGAG